MRSYVNDVNFWGDTNAEELAKLYGTPIYVYNENILRQSMRTVKNIITKYPYTANYSIKANSNLRILKIVQEKNILVVKGSVPGPNGSYLIIERWS